MGTKHIVPIIDHGIVIGLPTSERKLLLEAWSHGLVTIDPISHADIRYTLEYIDKQVFGASKLFEMYGDFEPPFAHFSKGLGVDWIEQHLDDFDKYGVLEFTDTKKYTLPPYFRDKYNFAKKPYQEVPDSILEYAESHNLSIQDALFERCVVVERSNQQKGVHSGTGMYNIDKLDDSNDFGCLKKFFKYF